MSDESAERAIIKALENQVSFAYAQNRELVFAMTDLKNRLDKLEADNATLRMYYKDWCEGRSKADY